MIRESLQKCLWVSAAMAFLNFSALSPWAHAADYYVSPNGNDSNSGTISQPFQTLKQATRQLKPGDTLFLRSGSYMGSRSIIPLPKGDSWQKPITIKAYLNEHPVITAEKGNNNAALQLQSGEQFLIFSGLIIDGGGGNDAVKITKASSQAHHIRIEDSEIKNASNQGVLTTRGSNDNEFINLHVHNNGTDDFDHGFYIKSSNNLIKGCNIHDNAGWGVSVWGGDPNYNRIEGNRIHNNAAANLRGTGIGLYTGDHNEAINNIVWENVNEINVNYGATNSLVAFNTVFNGRNQGIIIGERTEGSKVFNNIVYNNSHIGVSNSSPSATIIRNLIFKNAASKPLRAEIKNVNDRAGTVDLKAQLYQEPLFVSLEKLDMRLQAQSPAIDAGIEDSSVPLDFMDRPRRQGIACDLGAIEGIADDISPRVEIVNPNGSGPLTEDTFVDVSASDNMAVSLVEVFIDDLLIGASGGPSYRIPLQIQRIAPGSHRLIARATDTAGNSGTAQILIEISPGGSSILTATPLPDPTKDGVSNFEMNQLKVSNSNQKRVRITWLTTKPASHIVSTLDNQKPRQLCKATAFTLKHVCEVLSQNRNSYIRLLISNDSKNGDHIERRLTLSRTR